MTGKNVNGRTEFERCRGLTLRRAMQSRMERSRDGDGAGVEYEEALMEDKGADHRGDSVICEAMESKEIAY